MSAVTRIKRPTTATPRNLKRERLVHVSTDYRWLPRNPFDPAGPVVFRKAAPGTTYRKRP